MLQILQLISCQIYNLQNNTPPPLSTVQHTFLYNQFTPPPPSPPIPRTKICFFQVHVSKPIKLNSIPHRLVKKPKSSGCVYGSVTNFESTSVSSFICTSPLRSLFVRMHVPPQKLVSSYVRPPTSSFVCIYVPLQVRLFVCTSPPTNLFVHMYVPPKNVSMYDPPTPTSLCVSINTIGAPTIHPPPLKCQSKS